MKTKSSKPGSDTSVEVAKISQDGFSLRLDQRELFVPFEEFPWFKNVPASKIQRVKRPHPDQLSWADLDIDLAVDSIEFPERYRLKWRDSRSEKGRLDRKAAASCRTSMTFAQKLRHSRKIRTTRAIQWRVSTFLKSEVTSVA